jgi:hypothetical protein
MLQQVKVKLMPLNLKVEVSTMNETEVIARQRQKSQSIA